MRAGLAVALLGILLMAGAAAAALPTVPDPTWGTDGRVEAVLRVGNTVYLGGTFANLRDTQSTRTAPVTNLAAIDAATGQPTSFAPVLNGSVFALAASPDGSRLYAAGNFTTVNGQKQQRIAAFDTSTGALLSWKPFGWPNNVVRALTVTPAAVYFGGDFTKVGSVADTRIAAVSPADGSAIPGFSASADALVRRLLVTGGRLYAGGNFNTVDGVANAHLSALNPSTGAVISGVYHPTYPVLALAAGAALYVGGGGGGGKALAVNSSTGAKLWEINTDGNVQAVTVLNNVPYFGGHFLKYNGIAANQIARASAATGALDTTWLPSINSGFLGVFALSAASPGELYVGGSFTRVGTTPAYNFAQFTDLDPPGVANLSVSLSAPASVGTGTSATFTATVSNAGPQAAQSTVLTDVLPAGVSFGSAPGCTYASSTRTVSCPVGSVPMSGSVTVPITVTANQAGTLTDTVSVDTASSDPNPADNSAAASVQVLAASGADLAVKASAPAKAAVGAAVKITLTVTNRGPLAAAGVTLVETPPVNAALGTVTPSAGTCTTAAPISCSLGSLASGASATVVVVLTAPGAPQTIMNTASVSATTSDPVAANNSVATPVTIATSGGDTTPPAMTGLTMLDTNHDGFVDTVSVTFNEPLAVCAAPCTSGWKLQNVPSGGVLQSVTVAGSTATLHIGGWTDDPNTGVNLFTVALGASNGIQDAAGNHSSFAATAPADGAGPVPVGFDHHHDTTGACAATPSTSGLAEVCDDLTAEWSEPLLRSSIPATTAVTIADPGGAGDDTVRAPGFFAGALDLGSAGYFTQTGASATFPSSVLLLSPGGDALTLQLNGACTGTGCASLAAVKNVTFTYVPPTTITDAAGNPAGGSFVKTQTMW